MAFLQNISDSVESHLVIVFVPLSQFISSCWMVFPSVAAVVNVCFLVEIAFRFVELSSFLLHYDIRNGDLSVKVIPSILLSKELKLLSLQWDTVSK